MHSLATFLFPAHLASVTILSLLLADWNCSGFISFNSCQNMGQAQVTVLSPNEVSRDTEPFVLTVEGDGFTPESEILWGGTALETRFVDGQHLQSTITQETLDSADGASVGSSGGSVESSVRISVRSPVPAGNGSCPKGNTTGRFLVVR
jgi:hypothetical protein